MGQGVASDRCGGQEGGVWEFRRIVRASKDSNYSAKLSAPRRWENKGKGLESREIRNSEEGPWSWVGLSTWRMGAAPSKGHDGLDLGILVRELEPGRGAAMWKVGW